MKSFGFGGLVLFLIFTAIGLALFTMLAAIGMALWGRTLPQYTVEMREELTGLISVQLTYKVVPSGQEITRDMRREIKNAIVTYPQKEILAACNVGDPVTGGPLLYDLKSKRICRIASRIKEDGGWDIEYVPLDD